MTTFPPRDETPDWDALARFRAGESDAAESTHVVEWLRAHPADAGLLDALDGAVAEAVDPQAGGAPIDVERALAAVHQRMDEPRATRPRALRLRRFPPARRAMPWLAGGALAAAAVALLAVRLRSGHVPTVAGVPGAAGAQRVFATAVGVVDSTVLTDGTRVVLAPASRLVVAAGYGRGAREVTVQGTARFIVRHDANLPFTVHAGDAAVRDVGTRFVVRVRDAGAHAASSVAVAVLEGEVSLAPDRATTAPVALHAGDRGVLLPGHDVVAMRGTATDDDEAWTRGRLVYRGATLAEVRDDIRRWYGIDLRVTDSSLESRRITATFEGQDAGQVLNTIALALGVPVERSGSAATLGSPAPTP